MNKLKDDIQIFLDAADSLTERLDPPRRPQDAGSPDCSPLEISVLHSLGCQPMLKMGELAESIGVPLSTATRLVDSLVAKALVARQQSATDGRIVEVVFSPLGKQINQYIQKTRGAEAKRMLGKLSEAQRQQLISTLAAILES